MITTAHQPTAVRSIPLAAGDAGIAQTVSVMHSLIDRGAVDPHVREQALGIVRSAGVGARDSASEIAAVFAWVKANMRFQKDVSGGEYLCSADYLLKTLAGDCDDYVILTGALLKSLGVPVRITTIAADREEPGRMSHVYLEAQSKGEWIPLDGTQARAVPGWAPPRYFRKKIWERPGLSTQGLQGLRRAARGRHGLQDLTTDLNALTQMVATTGQAVATAIAANNPPAIPGYRITGVQPIAGSAQTATAYAPNYSTSTFGTISPWVLLAAAGVLIALVVRK